MSHKDAFEANRVLWNARAANHIGSEFYDVEGFVSGRNSLSAFEMELLGEVKDQDILHLQCHFGQDTLSLARLGARVTGLDLSGTAIDEARKLADRCALEAQWILGNVVDHHEELDGRFDTVFSSYGTIGWFPDLDPWAGNIMRYLKPGGRFVFVEFHPAVWMFDNDFTHVQYSYFNRQEIIEVEKGTYADRDASIDLPSHTWNHDLGEVCTALLTTGLRIEQFREVDGTPHDCFANTVKGADGLIRIKGFEGKLPMAYGLVAQKP